MIRGIVTNIIFQKKFPRYDLRNGFFPLVVRDGVRETKKKTRFSLHQTSAFIFTLCLNVNTNRSENLTVGLKSKKILFGVPRGGRSKPGRPASAPRKHARLSRETLVFRARSVRAIQ